MTKVVDLRTRRWVIGTWTDDPENPTVEWHVEVRDGQIEVSGVDCEDGEEFSISEVAFDGKRLTFAALMPSTGHLVRHEIEADETGSVGDTLTWRDKLYRVG